jgi:hypothetical protein
MSDRLLAQCDTIGEQARLVYLTVGERQGKFVLDITI